MRTALKLLSARAAKSARVERSPKRISVISLRTFFLVIALAVLLCWVFTQSHVIAAAEDPNPISEIKSIPHTEIVYYDLQGQYLPEVRHEMEEHGPVDQFGRRRDAYTFWEIHWKWPFQPNGKPDFSKVELQYKITVTLPRWRYPKDTRVEYTKRWQEFVHKMAVHELGHVQNVNKNVGKISNAIRAQAERNPKMKAKEANLIAERILEEIRELDKNYDRDTDHGRAQGVIFP